MVSNTVPERRLNPLRHDRPVVADDGGLVGVLALLSESGLRVAPHVAGRLLAALDRDAEAVVDVVRCLSPSERSGARFLPNPPPRVPAAAWHYDRSEHAFAVARTVAARTDGEVGAHARMVAGEAALAAGCVEDAAEQFDDAYATGAGEVKAQAAAGLMLASFLRHGSTTPPPPPNALRTGVAGSGERRAWCRVGALATVLSAARAQRTDTRGWLAEFTAAARADPALDGLRQLVTAWTWLLLGETEEALNASVVAGPPSRLLLEALRAGVAGDTARGIQLLSVPAAFTGSEDDMLLAGLATSSLIEACRAVALSLLWLWTGDLRGARQVLTEAAARHPIGLVFGGLGIALARRLELAIDGECGPLSEALLAVRAGGARIDHHLDRGIRAYLAGETEEAALQVSLSHERAGASHPFDLPGLDEVGPLESASRVGPPDAHLARWMRRKVREAGADDLRRIDVAGRDIRSPFERGRFEALLGSAYLRRNHHRPALKHLRLAQSLFAEAGASAWRATVQERLARAGGALAVARRSIGDVTLAVRAADPLAACRAEWEVLLSARELEIAMLIITEGATNRDIAERLLISVRTVEVHSRRLFAKLGVRTRMELAILAFRTVRFA